MNPEQWTSLIRTVLAIAIGPGSYVAMKGVLPPDLANQLIPVLVPVIMAGGAAVIGKWGVTTHSAAAVVAAVNSDSVPGVKAVRETSSALAVSVTPTGDIKNAETPPASIDKTAAHS
jgi:hypothetical protein